MSVVSASNRFGERCDAYIEDLRGHPWQTCVLDVVWLVHLTFIGLIERVRVQHYKAEC